MPKFRMRNASAADSGLRLRDIRGLLLPPKRAAQHGAKKDGLRREAALFILSRLNQSRYSVRSLCRI